MTKLGDIANKSVIKNEEIPFTAIMEYIQRICYGNKVVYPQDRVIIDKFVKIIFNSV